MEMKKMEIKVEFGIRKGQKYEQVFVDGNLTRRFEVSRKLTGSSDEDGDGILNRTSTTIKYGNCEKIFTFDKPLDVFSMTPKEYIEEVLSRAKTVKAWIDTIDFENVIKFHAEDQECK
jgi:hypothetical protein